MKLTEIEFRSLISMAVWKQNNNELLILGNLDEMYYLGIRNLETKDGMVCHSYPTPELAQKAFLLAVLRSNPLPSSIDLPDLFRSQITLDEATNGFKKTLNGIGHATCPCCDGKSNIYKIKIPVGGLMALGFMVHKNVQWRNGKVDSTFPIPYTHVDEFPRKIIKSRSVGKLVHWKLVERAKNEDPKKSTSGLWRPTILGANYFRGYFAVRSHIIIYRNKFQRYEGDMVYFNNVAGEFDFEELMDERGGIYKEKNNV